MNYGQAMLVIRQFQKKAKNPRSWFIWECKCCGCHHISAHPLVSNVEVKEIEP